MIIDKTTSYVIVCSINTSHEYEDPFEVGEDEFSKMIMRHIAKRRKERGHDLELDGEEKDEDPLAGDVDRSVEPDTPMTPEDHVAQQYGDYTE